jgi:hypothetical protein
MNMPNCFQLLRDGAAVPLNEIDAEMCRHFNVPCHSTLYYEAWYDTVGHDLAAGQSFDQIRSTYADFPRLVEVASWIEKHFTVRSWYERKGYEKNCMNDITMTDIDLFDSRPTRTEVCPRCRGHGNVSVGYALHPSRDPIDGVPEGAIRAFVAGSFDVFYAAREAAELAQRAGRPVTFQCLDHVVVVHPGDDPDQVAHAWWLRQYGETPEATWSRR